MLVLFKIMFFFFLNFVFGQCILQYHLCSLNSQEQPTRLPWWMLDGKLLDLPRHKESFDESYLRQCLFKSSWAFRGSCLPSKIVLPRCLDNSTAQAPGLSGKVTAQVPDRHLGGFLVIFLLAGASFNCFFLAQFFLTNSLS